MLAAPAWYLAHDADDAGDRPPRGGPPERSESGPRPRARIGPRPRQAGVNLRPLVD